jgi:hypothetical protein
MEGASVSIQARIKKGGKENNNSLPTYTLHGKEETDSVEEGQDIGQRLFVVL